MCNLESDVFNPQIKDGVCLLGHMAHLDGMRYVGKMLKAEALAHYPELWSLMLQERVERHVADCAARDKVIKSAGDS
jgi:hypothetical protein